jgi:hypothetical protein
MNGPLFLVPVFASILTLVAPSLAPAQGDPAALRQQHMEAVARGDVAGALALYTDDAVIAGRASVLQPLVSARRLSRRSLSAVWRLKLVPPPSAITCLAMC